jgi:hypothetical protein
MPLRCPVCKADNAAGPACRRCKADLGTLFALEEQRTALLMRAREALDNGGLPEALRCAHAANDLRRGADSQRWLAMLNLFTDRFGEAWQAYQATNPYG